MRRYGMITLRPGDCRDILPGFTADSFDACVTDPPYNLVSIQKRFGKTSSDDPTKTSERARSRADPYARTSVNFMGRHWDTEIAHNPAFWKSVYRILKPGAHLIAFSSTRTYDQLASAIRATGFEIRDMLLWIYATGLPKSHRVANDPAWGTALKPAAEPIVLARKPLIGTVANNMRKYGTGAINIKGCLVGPRWPANVTSDGSDETLSRYFFSAKADADDRWGSRHPTIKPVELMRWLVRMVGRPGGTIIDPFAGSGTTGIAAWAEGIDAVLIEREAEYIADIQQRIAFYEGDQGHSLIVKNYKIAKQVAAGDDTPLFTR